jgi:hypothetical protein
MRIWFPLFSYFEENVKTAVPNEYCLPGFISDGRAKITNWLERKPASAYWIIVFLIIILTYSLSFTKKANYPSLIEG